MERKKKPEFLLTIASVFNLIQYVFLYSCCFNNYNIHLVVGKFFFLSKLDCIVILREKNPSFKQHSSHL